MIWCAVMFMAMELDRANLSQALTDNFLVDMHMTTNGIYLAEQTSSCLFKLDWSWRLTSNPRLQYREYHLRRVLPRRRVPVPATREVARSGPVDSVPDCPLLHRVRFSILAGDEVIVPRNPGTAGVSAGRIHSRGKYHSARLPQLTDKLTRTPWQVVLYLSYFYKHHELTLRLGFFWTGMFIADILAAILAFGLLHMRNVHGYAGWRWLFLVEV